MDKVEADIKELFDQLAIDDFAYDKIKLLATIGLYVENLKELLEIPDQDGYKPTFISVGVDDHGDWQVCRWIKENPFDEDGPIGTGNNCYRSLKEAYKINA